MSWLDVAVTLGAATLTSVLCASIFYEWICAISDLVDSKFVPLEPCVIIAIVSALAGCTAYYFTMLLKPVPSVISSEELILKTVAVDSSKETITGKINAIDRCSRSRWVCKN